MAKLRTKTTASSLCKALADESAAVREAAAQQLRYITGPATTFAVEPLRKALADPNAIVRSMAVIAPGKIGPKAAAAVPDLLRLLNDPAGKERANILDTLGQIGVGIPEVPQALLAALRDTNTRDVELRTLAVWPSLPTSGAPRFWNSSAIPTAGRRTGTPSSFVRTCSGWRGSFLLPRFWRSSGRRVAELFRSGRQADACGRSD